MGACGSPEAGKIAKANLVLNDQLVIALEPFYQVSTQGYVL
jgi:hypothetical protein